MAKVSQERKAVAMVAPSGAKVTVAEESVDKFKARGYREAAAPARPAKATPRPSGK